MLNDLFINGCDIWKMYGVMVMNQNNRHIDIESTINYLRAQIGGYMSCDSLQGKIPRPMWVDLIYLKNEIGDLVKKGLKEGVKI